MKVNELRKMGYIKRINEFEYKCMSCNKIFSKIGISTHHFYNHEKDGIKKKEELRKIATKNNNDPEMKKKISKKTKEAFQRDDVKENFNKFVERIKVERIGEGNPMYGKHHTEEWKQNHSKMITGFTHSEEVKEKIRVSQTGKKHTLESIEIMRNRKLGKKDSSETKLKKSTAAIGRRVSFKTKELIRKSKLGNKNPMYRKFRTIEYIKKNYKIFYREEEMRYDQEFLNNGVKKIQVHCKYNKCSNSKEKGGWFTPSGRQIENRISSLETKNGNDGSYFYCSSECKRLCPLYGLNPTHFTINQRDTAVPYTQHEKQVFNNYVLTRDNYKCQYCGKKAEHVHHERPQKLEPFFALDPDLAWAVCSKCHYEKGHKDECSTGNIAAIICKE